MLISTSTADETPINFRRIKNSQETNGRQGIQDRIPLLLLTARRSSRQ